MGSFIIALGIGVASAGLMGLAAIRWMGPLGFLDVPGGRKLHSGVIPRVGGAALAGTLGLGLLLGWLPALLEWPGWVGLLLLFLLGVLDDRFCLRARWKAIGGLCIAAGLALSQANGLASTAAPLEVLSIPIPRESVVIGALLTALYWVMPQAYNLIDGANGLALGSSIIVLVTLFLAGVPQPLLLGGVLGVFLLNWPRAKCFLGDGGSLTLGLLLTLLSVHTFGRTNPNAILWLFAYPLADVCMVVMIRLVTEQPLGMGDRNHFHHHWKRVLGKHSDLRVPILWFQVAVCCSGALLHGVWAILPAIGLVAMAAQIIAFSVHAIRAHRLAVALVSQVDSSEGPVLPAGMISD